MRSAAAVSLLSADPSVNGWLKRKVLNENVCAVSMVTDYEPVAILPPICPFLRFGSVGRSSGQRDGNVTTQGLLVVCYHGNAAS